jgi:serine/threonine-protein kinase RsbW
VRLSFEMSARLEAIDAMVLKLRQAAEPFLDPESLFGFELAASEALTNVVRHAYADPLQDAQAKVELTLACDAGVLVLELRDQGKAGPADMFAAVPKLEDIDIFAEHGRGLALIQHYSESADYKSDQKGNHLRMRFKAIP